MKEHGYLNSLKKNLFSWFSGRGFKANIKERFAFDLDEITQKLNTNLLKRPIPEHFTWLHLFGSIIICLFIIQIITGIVLCFYYKPTIDEAYLSIKYIMNQVPYGWLIRSIHHWAANLMIMFIFVHVIRVYFMGAYKKPRELLWITGIVNLTFACAFGFTGYLLPWDKISYWATSTMTSEIADIPMIGKYIMLFIRGGEEVGNGTLTRFFVAHITLLPAMLITTVVIHVIMIIRQGIAEVK